MGLGTTTGAIGVFFWMEKARNLFFAFSTPFLDVFRVISVDLGSWIDDCKIEFNNQVSEVHIYI